MFRYFTSSRTSILQLSIIATFLSIRSKIRPGVAIITWTETEIWAKLLYICVHEPRSVPYQNLYKFTNDTATPVKLQNSHVNYTLNEKADMLSSPTNSGSNTCLCLRCNTACSMRGTVTKHTSFINTNNLCYKSDVSDKCAFDFCDWLSKERCSPPLSDQCFLEHRVQSSIVLAGVDEFYKKPRSHLKILCASRVL